MEYQHLVIGNEDITDHELGGSFLSAPSALSIGYGQGVLGQNDPLGFVPGTLDYDHRIADLSGLCDDAMAVDRVAHLIAFHTASILPSLSRSSMILHTRS